jgi:diketogulonate reductase-like aldo/keto reductase
MELREQGKLRHIGVSNFTPSLFDAACDLAPIFANQVEYHPYLSQRTLIEKARRADAMLTAYSPLARGRVLDDPTLKQIGEQYGKNPAQVVIRWMLQQDHVTVIPKAADAEHRRANFDVFDFELTDHEMQQVHELNEGERIIDPGFAPDWER